MASAPNPNPNPTPSPGGGGGGLNLTFVVNNGEKVVPLVLDGSTSIQNAKVLVAAMINLPASGQKWMHKGAEMKDGSKTLAASGVSNQDIIEIRGLAINTNLNSLQEIPQHIWMNPAALQETIKGNPKLLNQLLHQNPVLAEAVMSNNTFMLEQYFIEQRRAREERKRQEDMKIAQLQADPFDVEAQKKIQEIIREKNIRENMEQAIEHNPESFGSVIMLYIPCAVNKHKLKAFVDSGAQMTIMSQKCAEDVGLSHLIDKRWQGMAKGVGTSRIIGRIHAAQIQIGSAFFTMSITILENQDMQFLFGLDQLKRHQACIDLKENCLRIQGQVVPFLSEKDIPKSELHNNASSSSSSAPTKRNSNSMQVEEKSARKSQKMEATSSTSSSNRQPARPPQQQQQQPTGGAPSASEGIAHLMNMGFSQAKAQEALQVCGGNLELAASYLFNSMA